MFHRMIQISIILFAALVWAGSSWKIARADGSVIYLPVVLHNPIDGSLYYDDPSIPEYGTETPWSKNRLAYTIVNTASGLSTEQARRAIAEAFGLWSAVANIHFYEVPNAADADIVLSWGAGVHGDRWPFDGPGHVLAHAQYPEDGLIHFDADERWVVDSEQADGTHIDLVTVAAHEIGHAIGLQHSELSDALMYKTYTAPHRRLHNDDITGVRQLYNAKPLTDVRISGPNAGSLGTSYTFFTELMPKDASEPIIYTWSPAPASGQGTPQAIYRWKQAGRHSIGVQVSNNFGTVTDAKQIDIVDDRMATVTVDFESLFNPESSNECEAEAYLIIKVNGVAVTYWKDMTDRDISTIPDCEIAVPVKATIPVGVRRTDPILVSVEMYEKDGDYHLAATSERFFANAVAWDKDGQRYTDYSRRASNPYGDQDYQISYRVFVDWP